MRKRNLLLSILSGLLLAASMPKPGIWVAAWLGLAPLLAALRGARARDAALYGLTAGFVYYGIILFWLTIFGYLPWCLVALKEGFWLMLFAVAAARLMPERTGWWGYLAVPAAWTVSQWARVLGPLGFTWGSLAHTQANNLPIIQLAAITGPWGIDFLLCLFSLALMGTVLSAWQRKRFRPAGAAALVVAVVWLGGFAVLTPPLPRRGLGGGFRVAVIQGALPHEINPEPSYMPVAYAVYDQMSRKVAQARPDFIVWPETTVVDNITEQCWGPFITQLAKDTNANYVIGGYDPSGDPLGRSYNSAHFYGRDGRKLGVYHKVHLVPYGEFVPLRDRMPWLKRYGIRDVDVLPGSKHKLINTEVGKVGVSICFESLFPAVSAQETRNGASTLFIITNDAWFERTQAARHHLMMSRLRAVENRRYVVRAAATGMSAIIDPYGRIEGELPVFTRGVLTGDIAPLHGLTPYARFGDWFVFVCIGLLLAPLALRREPCSEKR